MTERPTPDEWQVRLPELQVKGGDLKGPCPNCGGTDRFFIQLRYPHLFNCRGCSDGRTILRVVFGDTRPMPTQIQQNLAAQNRAWAEREAQRRATRAMMLAGEMLGRADMEEHPYLESKGFPKRRGFVLDDKLLLPIRDFRSNTLLSLQTITADGEKKYLYGGRTAGGVHRVRPRGYRERWYCEGFATALSIIAALGYLSRRAEVVVCYSAGNLQRVAKALGKGCVVADHDLYHCRDCKAAFEDVYGLEQCPGCGGRVTAPTGERVARETGLPYWLPPHAGWDANDYFLEYGVSALAKALKGVS